LEAVSSIRNLRTPHWWEPEGKRPLGRRRRWVDNIKMDLREKWVIWTGLIWLRIRTSGLVNTVMNLRVP
jgi:hypothetical protein